MQIHASCAARDGEAVLLLGPAGSGKSDLVLRLIDRGFILVADDRVDIDDGYARPPAALAGLLEVRGIGIVRLPHLARARVRLVVQLGGNGPRLPPPARHRELDVPLIYADSFAGSAAQRVTLALDCALGRVAIHTGAISQAPNGRDAA